MCIDMNDPKDGFIEDDEMIHYHDLSCRHDYTELEEQPYVEM